MADLLGGQVDATFMNINTGLPNIKGGKLRALAITSAKRSPLLPDVPTMDELGIKGVTVYSWQAFAAPKGLPADIKAKLHEAIVAGLNDPAVKPKLLIWASRSSATRQSSSPPSRHRSSRAGRRSSRPARSPRIDGPTPAAPSALPSRGRRQRPGKAGSAAST